MTERPPLAAAGAIEARRAEEPSAEPLKWHAVDVDEVLAVFETRTDGLAAEEAVERLALFGPNRIPRLVADGRLRLLWRQIHNPLIWLLLAATALAISLGKTVDGLVVFGVVVANAAIGFLQELRAGRAIEALVEIVPEQATVVRSGQRLRVAAADVVPGDVVVLASGDKVPADLRLLATRNLRVDESALTGESVPVDKDPAAVAPEAPIADRTAMAFGGTLVTYGTGTGVTVATGGATELGRISELLESAAPAATPLTRAIARFARWFTVAIALLAAALAAFALARGYPAGEAVLVGIALAVGAIPEALPAVVTIALAIGVQRLARRQAIVRSLPAVETLGSTTVICTDKTGTLTRNEMTVQELWTPSGSHRVSGVGYSPAGEVEGVDVPHPALVELVRAGLLCNDARLSDDDGAWRLHGDPTEGALVVVAAKVGLDPERTRLAWPRLDTVPFESEHRFMATLHATGGGRSVVFLKGAPEAVLPRCDGHDATDVAAAIERITGQGMRVLALASKRQRGDDIAADGLESGFELLGLQGMIDPPREEVLAAVGACRSAGIAIKMVTGDHPRTAEAIAGRLGLASTRASLTGNEIERFGDEEFAAAAATADVLARVAPEHKLRLVEALQRRGEVVAVTGDGVNDAPAVKQADIGVAMGVAGTSVATEAADVVLADDNFATIAAAVEEGRRIYDNLVKALAFVLPTNLGFALIILASVLSFPIVDGDPLHALDPVQLLWINLVAVPLLSLPLAFEAAEPNLLQRPPRPPGAPILGRFVLIRTAVVAALMAAGTVAVFLLEYERETGRGIAHEVAAAEAQTIAVTAVVLFQCLYLIQSRSLLDSARTIGLWTNPAIYLGIAALLALQLAFVYMPFMNGLFGSEPLGLHAWVLALAAGSVVIPVVALEKRWRRRAER